MAETTTSKLEELARECVARGAAILDERAPGWADKIDLDYLHIHRPTCCVLGQLGGGVLGGYSRKLRELDLGLGYSKQSKLGFEDGIAPFVQLQPAWIEAILERRTS